MAFDPRNINNYSLEELLGFVQKGEVTFEDLQKCGLRWDKMDLVKGNYACLYGCPVPETPAAPKPDVSKLYEDLFADMREDLMKYKENVMHYLFGKIPPTEAMKKEDCPIGHFLKAGLKLTFDDLYRGGILPRGNRTLEQAIFKVDFEVPQLRINELGDLPAKRTDVYFFGLPTGGQSCVMAGIINYLQLSGEGKYVPYLNSKNMDPCRPYFDAIVKGLSEYKAPQSTAYDTLSFLQFNLGPKYDHEVTFVEHGDEALRDISRANTDGKEILWQLGVCRCLKNANPKMLFFLVDYSAILGMNPCWSAIDQIQALENALLVLCSDGEGPRGEKNCTMSKVRNVAVVVTKSDLMDFEMDRKLTREERDDIAFDCLNANFRSFMNDLSAVCMKFGINANIKGHVCEPYVTTFSLGQFYLGNSVIYDPVDSKRLADFIIANTEKRRKGLFDFL